MLQSQNLTWFSLLLPLLLSSSCMLLRPTSLLWQWKSLTSWTANYMVWSWAYPFIMAGTSLYLCLLLYSLLGGQRGEGFSGNGYGKHFGVQGFVGSWTKSRLEKTQHSNIRFNCVFVIGQYSFCILRKVVLVNSSILVHTVNISLCNDFQKIIANTNTKSTGLELFCALKKFVFGKLALR